MKNRTLTQLTLVLALLGLPALTPLKAGTYSTGFDTDPTLDAVPVQAFFNSRWDDGTGTDPGNPGGYMSLTDAANDSRGKLVFPDFEPGIPVKAFHFEVDCRIGGGTNDPADGFSINLCAPDDPHVTESSNIYAAGWGGWGAELSLPEEGSRTGIAIGFDAWDSGAGAPNGGPFALTPPNANPPDVIGFSVRVDGTLIAQVPAATKNGDVTDVNSLQTGPNTSGVAGLGWAHFIVDLNTDGKLDITWKGTKVVNQMQTNYTPAPRRVVFAARTGGANENHHFDNISLTTTPATTATVTKAVGSPTQATFEITDVPPSIVNSISNPAQANIQLTIDGAAKTPLNITKVGTVTTIVYTPPTIYTSGSVHTYTLTARDSTLAVISKTGTFTLGSFVTVTAAHSVPAVQVDLTKPGFDIAMFQTDAARPGADPNRVLLSERQLRGEYGANTINLGAAVDGRFVHEGVINFSGDGDLDPDNVSTPLPTAIGNFLDDTEFYGLFGSTRAGDITDMISMEALCYVQLTRGTYRFGVNSDDGFRLSAGLSSPLGQTLGVFDGGRGAASSEFDVFVETDGFYPLRLVWFEGGGGANCELYTVDAAGTIRTLLNGPGGLPTYRVFPGTTPTYVEWTRPEPSSFAGLFETIGGHPINPIELDFSTIVAPGGVALTLDAAAVVPTLSTVDGKTVATIAHPIFLSGSTHNVGITFTGKPTQTLTFTTLIYQNLSESLKLPLGALKDPGFVFRVAQINAGAVGTDGVTAIGGIGTVNDVAEAVVAGLFGSNVATPNDDGGFVWGLDGVLNLDQDSPGNGNFIPNDPIPGIPGTLGSTDDIAAAVTTYVALPAPGLYTMGFNSDDGFRMRNSPNTPRSPLVITSPASVAGDVGSVRTPLAPLGAAQTVVGDIVLADPPNANPAILNGAALNGKIALIRRGVATFADKIQRAQAAGATAVIISNTLGRTPFPMGGTATVPITIPAVMISEPAGAAIEAALLLGPVSGNFGNEPQPVVGEFDGGRGASDTIFIVNALSAGLHPFRTSWNEGGGGANMEWFHVTSSGQKILLNDSSNPESLLTFKPIIAVTTVTFSAARDATITWTSLPGARYTVQVSTALTDGSWTTLARGILSAGATTSYVDPAVPAGQPQRFYRAVLE